MENLNELKSLLVEPGAQAQNIVITAHRNPDGDAIGSSLALYHFLKKFGHHIDVVFPSEYPDSVSWMPESERIIIFDNDQEKTAEVIKNAELIFCLDYNSLSRIDKVGEIIAPLDTPIAMIDHHLDPDDFAKFVLSDPASSSTCELIYDFIELLDQKDLLDQTIGECILTGILTDTGSFKYSTSSKLFTIVAELMKLGVDDAKIQDLVFNSQEEKQLRLLGHCLNKRMEILEEYHTGIIWLNRNDYDQFNIQRGDTEGIVNFLLKLKNVKLAAFITEQPSIVKISLRSKGDLSVKEIAQKHFKGGGHKNAAGGSSFHKIKRVIQTFKDILPEYKDQLQNPD